MIARRFRLRPLWSICLWAIGAGAAVVGLLAPLPGVTAPVAVAATSGPNGAPSAQTLATVRAQAAAVQANLVAGATRLDAARAALVSLQARADAATTAATKVADELSALRGQLAGYAADLYVHPTDQAAASALTGDRDLAVSVQGVAMLAIVNRGRADVLRTVVVDQQQAQQLQAIANQAVSAADAAQASVAAQVATLQAASDHAVATLNQALSAYQAEEQRQAAQAIAAARTSRNAAARAIANKQAAALAAQLAADAAGQTGSVADCAASSAGYPAGPWGGYANGLVPSSSLCPVTGGGSLRPDAAAAFNRMSRAYAQAFGSPLCVSDSYRTYGSQVAVFRHRPSLAAVPGTSNHGWGLAVDLGCGVEHSRTAQYRWMAANAGSFGWVHPPWAFHDPFEPWHWEFGQLSGNGGT